MWFRYAEIEQKTGGKRPFLTTAGGMVFGMAACLLLWPNGRQIAP